MSIAKWILSLMIPIFILVSITFCHKSSPYNTFVEGARDGIKCAFEVLPYLLAIMLATKLFASSGLAQIVGTALDNALVFLGVPEGLGLFILLRPLSGSGALSELDNIFSRYGVDSLQGLFASVLMSSTETIFYTIPVYLSPAGIKSCPKALWISIVSLIVGLLGASMLFMLFPPL